MILSSKMIQMVGTKQLKLFQDHSGQIEIKKHSALVAMNNIMTLQQRKSTNVLLKIAKDQLKRDPNKRLFSTDIGIVKRMWGIARNDNTELKESLRNLVSLVIEYNVLNKDKKVRWAFPFLSFAKIEEGTRGQSTTLEFELPTPILEAVKNPQMYVKLDLLILRGLNSKYSSALYESLKDYQNLKKIRIEIDNLRKLMGVWVKQYSIFTMFRKRVLDVAVKEINDKTDINIGFELERSGRKIVAANFRVTGIDKLKSKEHINQEIVNKLKRFWIKEIQIKELLAKHDEDYILANIVVVEQELEKGKDIRNVTAYLMKAFVVDFRPTAIEMKTRKQLIVEEKIIEAKSKEDEVQKLRTQYELEKKKVIQATLETEDDSAIEKLKWQFIKEVEESKFNKKIYEQKGFDYHAIQAAWYKFLGNRFLPDFLVSFEAYRAAESSIEHI